MKKPPAIELDKLSKRYRGSKNYALKDVSLTVKPGEIYGFLGPNGAGKTTLVRCLLNFIQPTAGSATILGQDVVRQSAAVKNSVGYLAGDVALYGKMTGRQLLDYLAALQPPKRPGLARALVRAFRAELSRPIETLSRGNRQKLGVIQAFMHDPEVLILDEPTTGLDPLMQETFYKLLAETKARGACVFFSSHNLPEVQRVCERIGFIRNGHLVAEKTLADLAKTATHTFDLFFDSKAPVDELARVGKVQPHTGRDPKQVSVVVAGDLSRFFTVLAKHKLLHFSQREVNLEAEFMRLYKKGRKS